MKLNYTYLYTYKIGIKIFIPTKLIDNTNYTVNTVFSYPTWLVSRKIAKTSVLATHAIKIANYPMTLTQVQKLYPEYFI